MRYSTEEVLPNGARLVATLVLACAECDRTVASPAASLCKPHLRDADFGSLSRGDQHARLALRAEDARTRAWREVVA